MAYCTPCIPTSQNSCKAIKQSGWRWIINAESHFVLKAPNQGLQSSSLKSEGSSIKLSFSSLFYICSVRLIADHCNLFVIELKRAYYTYKHHISDHVRCSSTPICFHFLAHVFRINHPLLPVFCVSAPVGERRQTLRHKLATRVAAADCKSTEWDNSRLLFFLHDIPVHTVPVVK